MSYKKFCEEFEKDIEKYSVFIINQKKYSILELKEFLKDRDIEEYRLENDDTLCLKPTKVGYLCCKYCGKVHKSNNRDILCEQCKENFGHSLYSEL